MTDHTSDHAPRMWLLGLASQAQEAIQKIQAGENAPFVFMLTRDQFPLILALFEDFTELLRENDQLKAKIERDKQRRIEINKKSASHPRKPRKKATELSAAGLRRRAAQATDPDKRHEYRVMEKQQRAVEYQEKKKKERI